MIVITAATAPLLADATSRAPGDWFGPRWWYTFTHIVTLHVKADEIVILRGDDSRCRGASQALVVVPLVDVHTF